MSNNKSLTNTTSEKSINLNKKNNNKNKSTDAEASWLDEDNDRTFTATSTDIENNNNNNNNNVNNISMSSSSNPWSDAAMNASVSRNAFSLNDNSQNNHGTSARRQEPTTVNNNNNNNTSNAPTATTSNSYNPAQYNALQRRCGFRLLQQIVQVWLVVDTIFGTLCIMYGLAILLHCQHLQKQPQEIQNEQQYTATTTKTTLQDDIDTTAMDEIVISLFSIRHNTAFPLTGWIIIMSMGALFWFRTILLAWPFVRMSDGWRDCCQGRWGLYRSGQMSLLHAAGLAAVFLAFLVRPTLAWTRLLQYLQDYRPAFPFVRAYLIEALTEQHHAFIIALAICIGLECIRWQIFGQYFRALSYRDYVLDHGGDGYGWDPRRYRPTGRTARGNPNWWLRATSAQDPSSTMLDTELTQRLLSSEQTRNGIPLWVTSNNNDDNNNNNHHDMDTPTATPYAQTTSRRRTNRLWGWLWKSSNNANNNTINDNIRDDCSVDFVSVQEEWASRTEEDPVWWSRENDNDDNNNNNNELWPSYHHNHQHTTNDDLKQQAWLHTTKST